VLGLKDQRLEHRNRVEGRAATPGSVAIAQPFNQLVVCELCDLAVGEAEAW
jgi:hypothetical protein